MGEDLSTLSRLILTLILSSALLVVVGTTFKVGNTFSRQFTGNMNVALNSMSVVELMNLNNYDNGIPGSILYSTLYRNRREIDIYDILIGGTTYDKPDVLLENASTRFEVTWNENKVVIREW